MHKVIFRTKNMMPGAIGRSQRGAQMDVNRQRAQLQGCSSTLFSHRAEPAILEFLKTSPAHWWI